MFIFLCVFELIKWNNLGNGFLSSNELLIIHRHAPHDKGWWVANNKHTKYNSLGLEL